ncbi:hypothetical protein BCV70DRAFT_197665 [Testicularia cyperi]|uniref:Uncharacterized protein n=1 Tax=Testicularia cyperi TaxID=1882483 RepID=A0A317XYV0_9BASI|nr:hypothetical protein BCV70DRAFT_197665 [Testicularia cyperi]
MRLSIQFWYNQGTLTDFSRFLSLPSIQLATASGDSCRAMRCWYFVAALAASLAYVVADVGIGLQSTLARRAGPINLFEALNDPEVVEEAEKIVEPIHSGSLFHPLRTRLTPDGVFSAYVAGLVEARLSPQIGSVNGILHQAVIKNFVEKARLYLQTVIDTRINLGFKKLYPQEHGALLRLQPSEKIRQDYSDLVQSEVDTQLPSKAAVLAQFPPNERAIAEEEYDRLHALVRQMVSRIEFTRIGVRSAG